MSFEFLETIGDVVGPVVLDQHVHFVGEFPQVVGDAFSYFDHFAFDVDLVFGLQGYECEGPHDAIADHQRDQSDMRHQKRGDITQIIQTLAR